MKNQCFCAVLTDRHRSMCMNKHFLGAINCVLWGDLKIHSETRGQSKYIRFPLLRPAQSQVLGGADPRPLGIQAERALISQKQKFYL